MGWAGFDFVVIDCEHGIMDYETAENMIRAAELSGYDANRAHRHERPATHPTLSRRRRARCDDSANQQQRARAQRRRLGQIPTTSANAADSLVVPQCLASKINPNMSNKPMKKHSSVYRSKLPKASRNADEIIAVEGADCIFMGARRPVSKQMGYPGQITHPEVVDAIETLVKKDS